MSFYNIIIVSMATELAVSLCCVWPLGNLTLIHLPTCVSGYRMQKNCDTSVLTPSLLQGQRDGETNRGLFHSMSEVKACVNNYTR